MDFGLALARHPAPGKPGELSGTRSYLAPAIFAAQPLSAATDLFSGGVTAYALIARRHPF